MTTLAIHTTGKVCGDHAPLSADNASAVLLRQRRHGRLGVRRRREVGALLREGGAAALLPATLRAPSPSARTQLRRFFDGSYPPVRKDAVERSGRLHRKQQQQAAPSHAGGYVYTGTDAYSGMPMWYLCAPYKTADVHAWAFEYSKKS